MCGSDQVNREQRLTTVAHRIFLTTPVFKFFLIGLPIKSSKFRRRRPTTVIGGCSARRSLTSSGVLTSSSTGKVYCSSDQLSLGNSCRPRHRSMSGRLEDLRQARRLPLRVRTNGIAREIHLGNPARSRVRILAHRPDDQDLQSSIVTPRQRSAHHRRQCHGQHRQPHGKHEEVQSLSPEKPGFTHFTFLLLRIRSSGKCEITAHVTHHLHLLLHGTEHGSWCVLSLLSPDEAGD